MKSFFTATILMLLAVAAPAVLGAPAAAPDASAGRGYDFSEDEYETPAFDKANHLS